MGELAENLHINQSIVKYKNRLTFVKVNARARVLSFLFSRFTFTSGLIYYSSVINARRRIIFFVTAKTFNVTFIIVSGN